MARGQSVSFEGKVTHVSSLVQLNGEYRVKAEVSNRKGKTHDSWLLRPGVKASMTIHINP